MDIEVGVSIPFIAGQWSLPSTRFGKRSPPWLFQSPSLRGSGRFVIIHDSNRKNPWCFNPLHCGAVVASIDVGVSMELRRLVSIPFIAGQWSLPAAGGGGARWSALVSIPFIAGQWSLPEN